ncbi:MAG: sugar transferase [Bacteroidetes bacterium]|nr:sugar transferase [Bacteroidota bacterium]
MNKRILIAAYVISDWLTGAASWTVLFTYRKVRIESALETTIWDVMGDFRYQMGLLAIPLFWIFIHAMAGMYQRPLKRHRILEIGQVTWTSLIGGLVLFFGLLLDDAISSYQQYYASLSVLILSHWFLTLAGRLWITTRTVKRIHSGQWSFPTLVIGGNERAVRMVEEIRSLRKDPGYRFEGFIQVNGSDTHLEGMMPNLGKVHDIQRLIETHQIQEVIIAIGSSDHEVLELILNSLEGLNTEIRIIPDIYDILSGSVRMSSIYGAPLIEIDRQIIPQWQVSIKRLMDWTVSIIALVVLLPMLMLVGLLVLLTSKGPVFYMQERIGRHGEPFRIIKFRTMHVNAEQSGPQLSRDDDPRITPVGRFLRKSRLDEFPQFFNVIRGDMALVGPRPERAHFIDQIMERAPHYRHLQKVRPGITSWGQVKYGYAQNVDEMVQRLRFDLIYIENMSIALDFKILFYTILTVLRGSGK